MPKVKGKIVIGVGIVGGITGLIYLATRVKAIPPTDIVLSDLIIEPTEVYIGEPVSISVIATNIGEVTGSYEITCEVNSDIRKKTVTLSPGESKVVAFSFTPTIAKSYTVSIDGLSGSFVAVAPVEEAAATIQIEVIGAETFTLTEGESYIVRVTVTNQSTRAGMPVEATLGVGITSVTELGYVLIPGQESSEHFAPSEISTFDYTMDIPTNVGKSGSIVAWVTDPAGADIVSAIEHFTITPEEIPAITPGWIEWTYGPYKEVYNIGLKLWQKRDWTIHSKGWRTEWTYGANQFEMREKQLEGRGVDTIGCYGNREACIGRIGVREIYDRRPKFITTTVVGINIEGYIIRNEEYNLGLDDPQARKWYISVIPIGVPLILTGQTSYSLLKDVLRKIESSGAGDVTNLILNYDEANTWWAKLVLLDASRFLDAITRLEWVAVYIVE